MAEDLESPALPASPASSSQEGERCFVVPEACRDAAGGETEFAHPADMAEHLENLSLEKQVCVMQHLPAEEAAEALAELDESVAVDLLENLDPDVAAQIIAEMSPDDAADVLDELEEGHRDALLNSLEKEDADELRRLLAFDPDSAAGIMNTEIILLDDYLDSDAAIRQIRQEMHDKENPYYAYVVDAHDILLGVLSLRDLMLARPGTLLKEAVRNQTVISIPFDMDKSEAAQMVAHYNFIALPVVDHQGHVMGMVTHDDIIDIIRDGAGADMLGMVGADPDETVDTPWRESVRKRLPWLFINMCNSAASASVVYLFEGSIAHMAVLAVLMPMVANQAGNTGQQALAVMIRQLAMERFDSRKSWLAVLRESKIGLVTGLFMACLSLAAIWIFTGHFGLAVVMSAALLADMALGAVAGGSIPLIFRRLGRDPAHASSIFLTTITDSAGFFFFLGLATLFLL